MINVTHQGDHWLAEYHAGTYLIATEEFFLHEAPSLQAAQQLAHQRERGLLTRALQRINQQMQAAA